MKQLPLVVRWATTVVLAFVLGILAPTHLHLDAHTPQAAHGSHVHASLASCCLELCADPADPDCAVCDFKARTLAVWTALPVFPPLASATFENPAPGARAPPLAVPGPGRTRAPPALATPRLS